MNNSSTNPQPATPTLTHPPSNTQEQHELLSYDTDTNSYQAPFEEDTESVSLAVVSAIAAVTETPPTDIPQLGAAIDTDALDTLMEPPGGANQVSFTFHDCEVTVKNNGTIDVRPESDR